MNNLYIMETEKYYGLNEPDKTTTIDSSNIDYNIPVPTAENPSLNTTNTSILYKASATSNYIKRDNCPVTFTIKKHNDAITDSSLCVIEIKSLAESGIHKDYIYDLFYTYGTKKLIYLGYEDTNKIFTNKLSSVITTLVTTLESDTDGCSAKAYLIQNDNTGAPIKYSLNKCTLDRLITFSYNETPIFRIQLTYNKELLIGDVLYSTNDNKLTLDALTNGANNTPIAICVIPDVYENLKNGDESTGSVHTARFVSINYMNCDSPSTGNKDTQLMYFGNYQVTIGNTRGGRTKDSLVGGKWNTKRCVFKATNQDKTSDKVDNNPGEGYCAPACCCDRYSTPGTKPGDWYLPMPGELYQIYANKTAINEKRTAIKGSGFYGVDYWSSREYDRDNEYRVYLDNGNVSSNYKNYRSYVLGFLAVEVPSFNIPSFKPSVNMDPVKLDASSSKKKPAVADILYSTKDGKLTLDKTTNGVTNTAIAICVIPEVTENFKNGDDSTGAVKTARFVSLNYMNYDSPSTGNKDAQDIYFGNSFTNTIGNVKGGTNSTAYIGGKWNTQQCLFKIANQDPYIYAGVTNNIDNGYSPAACCCVAYSTPGTKQGDWYLPMPGELYQIYANKTIINEKRTAIKGSGFNESYYWSSRGYGNGAYGVHFNNGYIESYSNGSNFYVLGFLALEV